jgi:hypothetical protein
METFTRNVSDLAASQRAALEAVCGHTFADNQHIVVQVFDAEKSPAANPPTRAVDFAILADLDEDEARLLTDAMIQRTSGREIGSL